MEKKQNIEQLKEIRDQIQKINPVFTDDLLYLLYEYVIAAIKIFNEDSIQQFQQVLQNNKDFEKFVQDLTLNNLKTDIINGSYDNIFNS